MAYTEKEFEVMNFLESLQWQRHTVESLEARINDEFGSKMKLELCDNEDNDEATKTDYNLMGNINVKDIFCDVDIYYLPMRNKGFDGADMYITEVGYEFG